jgi:hypothetical protein
MTDITTDAGSIGSSMQATIGAKLTAEERAETLLYALADEIVIQKGTKSHAFQQLTTSVSMQTVALGTGEAGAGTAQALVTASRTATLGQKVAWILQSWVSEFESMINWATELPQILGRARKDIQDVDAGALHATHVSTVGETGIGLVVDVLRQATVLLETVKLSGMGAAIFMLHTKANGQLGEQALGGSGVALNTKLPQIIQTFGEVPQAGPLQAFKGYAVGVPVFTSPNLPTMNTAADVASSLIIPKMAHGAITARVRANQDYMTDSQTANLKLGDSHGTAAFYGLVKVNDNGAITIVSKNA